MSKVYGAGIMGAGVISDAYLRLAPTFANLEVRAVADIVPQAARERAGQYGVRAQTPDELLDNPDVDVVVNLTVPTAHYEVTTAILSAGKHAYSEKPFVLAVDEGKAIQQLARERNLRVGSAPDTFLGGTHQQARAIVDAGTIGRVASGTMHVLGSGMEGWHPNPTFFFQPGAGPVLDLGPYYVTELVNLIGPVRRVTALTGAARAEREVTAEGPLQGTFVKVNTPTTIHAVLEFDSGAIVTLGASWDVRGHGHRAIELYGVDGSLFIPDPNVFDGELWLNDGSGDVAVEPWDHPLGYPNEGIDTPRANANYRGAGLADLMRSVETGESARCDIQLALHVVDVLTAILEAGASGQVITLSTTCVRPEPLGPEDARTLMR